MRILDAQDIGTRCFKMKPSAKVQKVFVEIGSRTTMKERLDEMVAEIIMERWERDNRVPGEWEITEAFRKLEPKRIHDILVSAWEHLSEETMEALATELTDNVDELLRDAVEEKVMEERANEPPQGRKRRKGRRAPKLHEAAGVIAG